MTTFRYGFSTTWLKPAVRFDAVKIGPIICSNGQTKTTGRCRTNERYRYPVTSTTRTGHHWPSQEHGCCDYRHTSQQYLQGCFHVTSPSVVKELPTIQDSTSLGAMPDSRQHGAPVAPYHTWGPCIEKHAVLLVAMLSQLRKNMAANWLCQRPSFTEVVEFVESSPFVSVGGRRYCLRVDTCASFAFFFARFTASL